MDPYRKTTLHPPIPPLKALPWMWSFRVWWARTRVRTESGITWNLSFNDTKGDRQYYRFKWTDDTIERVALICEGTPTGEPAALAYYYDQGTYRETRVGDTSRALQGVDFIHPTQVPTVARLARQAWDSYQRSRNTTPTTR